MRKAARFYQQQSEAAVPARETELAAFVLVTRDLAGADTQALRTRALGRNHDLWSLLLKDLGRDSNRLPDALRGALIRLAVWSMRSSIEATLQATPVEPLIAVNRAMIEALQAQQTAFAAQPWPSPARLAEAVAV